MVKYPSYRIKYYNSYSIADILNRVALEFQLPVMEGNLNEKDNKLT